MSNVLYSLTPKEEAREMFLAKHNGGREKWLSGNFVYYRMSRIVDIYFVGGFGTVQVGEEPTS
jgi:hypothetical protein